MKSLRFGELTANSNSPIFSVVKLWRVSRTFMYTECFYKFTACFRECLLLLCWFNPLFVYSTCLTQTWHNGTHVEYAFRNDKSMISGDK